MEIVLVWILLMLSLPVIILAYALYRLAKDI
jgi:hypothetical protein